MSDERVYNVQMSIEHFEIRNFTEVWGVGTIGGPDLREQQAVAMRFEPMEKRFTEKAAELGVTLHALISLMNIRIDPVGDLDALRRAALFVFSNGEG